MIRGHLDDIEAALVRDASGVYTDAEIEGLPGPVRRFFQAALAGASLAHSARLRMRGRIRIGRWLPFRAVEVLSPHVGFVWAARVAGIIVGSDRFVDGHGAMDWKLAGLIRVMHAEGSDVARSAAERAGAEALWVPTALLPRFGVEWAAADDNHISAQYRIADYPVHLDYTLNDGGRIRSVVFDRWGDPEGSGEYGPHSFAGEFTAHATFDGMTIPSEGRLGWHYGTERWSQGEFFQYRITDMELYPCAPTTRKRPSPRP